MSQVFLSQLLFSLFIGYFSFVSANVMLLLEDDILHSLQSQVPILILWEECFYLAKLIFYSFLFFPNY